MSLSTASKAIYLNCELKIGIRTDTNTAPASFYDSVNFTVAEITPPKQESKSLLSNMYSNMGAALASVTNTAESAKIKLEFNYMPPRFLALLLGADVSEVTQAAADVTADTVNTVLNMWVPLSNNFIAAHGTGTEIELQTSGAVTVTSDKYEIDLTNGMIRAIHADAVGTGMIVSYSKSARTWEQYLAGLSKSAYVQLSGEAYEKSSGKLGRLDIWCAALSPSAAVDAVKNDYFSGSLEGDLIMPSGKSSPWQWQLVTA
ncbi:hypothetical protein HUU62_08575 [Rhodoferax sp. 4810]|uniref:Uncharacterized protein n=1 Tax=Thiospirillum jenense TaxID=1653858 RepID=A0A839HDU4_9GAMM|nr:hypothetical protein [Thiospirillum jenense]MBB1074463.1 hypothetical protein [Rhodoferax jenense]MBB1125556.1 hypothetical protein [Thiospirillum jenense]